MKTFKDFVDNMDVRIKDLWREEWFFDADQPDYYRRPLITETEEYYKRYKLKGFENNFHGLYGDIYMNTAYATIFKHYKENILDDDDIAGLMYNTHSTIILRHFDLEDRHNILQKYIEKYGNKEVSLHLLYFCTMDFDTIDYDQVGTLKDTFPELYYDLPVTIFERYIREHPQSWKYYLANEDQCKCIQKIVSDKKETEYVKRSIIEAYCSGETVAGMEALIKQIISIDKRNIKYVYDILRRRQNYALALFNAKKLNRQTGKHEEYVFSDLLRGYFIMCKCCAKKGVNKTDEKRLGDYLSLIFLYRYNIDTITKVMFDLTD